MAINLKAWKSVDGEVVYIQESESGEGILGSNYVRLAGLDRVISDDFSTFEDFTTQSNLNANYYTQTQVDSFLAINSTNDIDRTNHTGTQLSNTISDFDNAVNNITNAIIGINDSQQLEINQNTLDNNDTVGVHSDVNLSGGITGDILTIVEGVVVPISSDFGFSVFGVIFEENGTISNGAYQWSAGNGSTGSRIGYIVPENCEIYQMAINVDSATVGTSASINIRRATANTADVNGSAIITTPVFTANNQIQPINPIQLSKGDILIPQTNTVVGSWSDARIYLYFRVIATSSSAKTTIQSVGTTNVNFTSTTFADIPGLSSTITLTRPGTLIGDLIYSAARSGTVNAATQFRVVINGVAGQSYDDTLSTFNDTGAATHFINSLPAGTYTISAQSLTSNPILISSAGLKLTAKED